MSLKRPIHETHSYSTVFYAVDRLDQTGHHRDIHMSDLGKM